MIEALRPVGIALALGLLVGLQRQRTDARLAGIRTFPLVTLLGTLCGLLAQQFNGWILAAGLGAVALVILSGNLPRFRVEDEPAGVTSEVTMLVMFALGAYLTIGSAAQAVVVGGAVAVLLHLKPQMHSLAARIGDADFKAIMQFTLISLVILPVLPNRTFGPLDVLNPFQLWLMLTLIVGISLGGYVVFKLLGSRAGAWASGVLGGLISSTATTVSVARRCKETPGSAALPAFVVLLASGVVFLRIALLVGATDGLFLRSVVGPSLTLAATLVAAGLGCLRHQKAVTWFGPEHANPTELKPALLFVVLYAAVLMGGAMAHQRFGSSGLYVVAALSGLADMDAITLSISNLVTRGEVRPDVGWRLILVASMANLGFKAAVVGALGDRRVFRRVALGFGLATLVGAAWLILA